MKALYFYIFLLLPSVYRYTVCARAPNRRIAFPHRPMHRCHCPVGCWLLVTPHYRLQLQVYTHIPPTPLPHLSRTSPAPLPHLSPTSTPPASPPANNPNNFPPLSPLASSILVRPCTLFLSTPRPVRKPPISCPCNTCA